MPRRPAVSRRLPAVLTLTAMLALLMAISVTPVFAAGPPDHLEFIVQPSPTLAASTITPAVKVAVVDAAAVVVNTDQTTEITLSITGGGTLNGDVTKTVTDGVATFDNLSIDDPGTYTLDAVNGDASLEGQSNSFIISPSADLELVDLSANPTDVTDPPATAGNDVVYSVTVRNNGPSDSEGYTVAAPLPDTAKTSLVSGGSCDGTTTPDTITCQRGALDAGDDETFDFALDIHSDFANTPTNSATLSLTATITSFVTPQPSGSTGNDSKALAFPVVARANLTISHQSTVGSVDPELDLIWANADTSKNTVTHTFLITNGGPSDAQTTKLVSSLVTPKIDAANATYCVSVGTGVTSCSPTTPYGGETSPFLLDAGLDATVILEEHADPDQPIGPTTVSSTATVSSSTPRTDGTANDGTGAGEHATSDETRIHTRPDAPINPHATAGNGNVILDWRAGASDGGENITNFVITVTPPTGSPSTPPFSEQTCGHEANTHPCADMTGLTNDAGAYQFKIQAQNEVGLSDFSTTVSATPSVNKSAAFLDGVDEQFTGTGVTGSTDQVVAKQSVPTGSLFANGTIGTLAEIFPPTTFAATASTSDPTNFCGGLACIGNELVENKITDPTNGRYLVDIFYAKGLAVGTGKKAVFFSYIDPATQLEKKIQLDTCPTSFKSAKNAAIVACVTKLVATPAQNPALRVQLSIRSDVIDPVSGVRK